VRAAQDLPKADIDQESGTVVEYPVVVIKIDDKIRCLAQTLSVKGSALGVLDIPWPHAPSCTTFIVSV
jgi:hypothetical protein